MKIIFIGVTLDMKKMTLICVCFFLFKKQSDLQEEAEKDEKQDMLCRFVVDGAGKTVGESIAIQKDLLIVKDKNDFLGLPLKHIESKGKKLLVKGLIDTTKAKDLGTAWKEDSYDMIDDEKED